MPTPAPSTQYQVFLWPARGLVLSQAIRATPHAHDAIQISLALDKPFRFKGKGGRWRRTQACLMDRSCPHELDGEGALQANLYVESESALGLLLKGLYLKKQEFAFLDDAFLLEARQELKRRHKEGLSCETAKIAYDAVLAAMAGPEIVGREPDSRVLKALEIFKALPEKRISAKELASQVALSESRLGHLFQQQLGIPVRRYLLWLKIVEAARHVNRPKSSATEAAHRAGFTDSPHLTRSFRQLLGISPRMLFDNRSFVQVLCCHP